MPTSPVDVFAAIAVVPAPPARETPPSEAGFERLLRAPPGEAPAPPAVPDPPRAPDAAANDQGPQHNGANTAAADKAASQPAPPAESDAPDEEGLPADEDASDIRSAAPLVFDASADAASAEVSEDPLADPQLPSAEGQSPQAAGEQAAAPSQARTKTSSEATHHGKGTADGAAWEPNVMVKRQTAAPGAPPREPSGKDQQSAQQGALQDEASGLLVVCHPAEGSGESPAPAAPPAADLQGAAEPAQPAAARNSTLNGARQLDAEQRAASPDAASDRPHAQAAARSALPPASASAVHQPDAARKADRPAKDREAKGPPQRAGLRGLQADGPPPPAMQETVESPHAKPAAGDLQASSSTAPAGGSTPAEPEQAAGQERALPIAPSAAPRGERLAEQGQRRIGPARQSPELTSAQQERLVQRVARAFETARARGEGTIRLRLSPPELGSLRLELQIEGGAMAARLEVETAAARDALVENLGALKQRLAEQSIRVERFDVDLADRRGGGGPSQQQNQHAFPQQHPPWRRFAPHAAAAPAPQGQGRGGSARPASDGGLDVII